MRLAIFLILLISFVSVKSQVTEISELENINDTMLLKGSSKPYSGIAIMKYPSGNLMLEIEYKNGLIHGMESSWFENGEIEKVLDHGQAENKLKNKLKI